jgi:hypothetical protein
MTFLLIVFSVFAIKQFIISFSTVLSDRYFYVREGERGLSDAFKWIKNNTNEKSTFLIDPFISSFYVAAERGMFVSYKHFPIYKEDILEWYERMKLCNDQIEFNRAILDSRQVIQHNYNSLRDEIIQYISTEYGIDYYLCLNGFPHSYPVVYSNDNYRIFRITEP